MNGGIQWSIIQVNNHYICPTTDKSHSNISEICLTNEILQIPGKTDY